VNALDKLGLKASSLRVCLNWIAEVQQIAKRERDMSSLAAGRDQLQTDWREMNKAFCGMAIGGIEVAFGQSLQNSE
jgi:hypothetical protein